MSPALYNEHDAYAAAWLRNLAAAGHIAPGDVDTRSVVDLRPSDMAGYAQFHAFAGIAGWSYALRLAGWPDDVPVWTGSCPCQPFSAAGRRAGFDDERHLWPAWFALIRECRPPIVFGEQVEAAVRLGWLDAVFADLEGEGYACGAAVLGAHSVLAPHVRQRLWFVAYAEGWRRQRDSRAMAGSGGETCPAARATRSSSAPSRCGRPDGLLGDAGQPRGGRHARAVPGAKGEGAGERSRDRREPDEPVVAGAVGGMGNANGRQHGGVLERPGGLREPERPSPRSPGQSASPAGSFDIWSDADWLPCRDDKARPVEPGTFPLAHGIPARVGRLRAYGNAIVPQVAATFIAACMDALGLVPTPSKAPPAPSPTGTDAGLDAGDR